MKAKANRIQKTSPWQRIFLESKANGAPYSEEQLLEFRWSWPKNTYLQRRLEYIRKHRSSDELVDLNRSAVAGRE